MYQRSDDTQFPYAPGPFDFRPPLSNRFILWLARLLAPSYMRTVGVAEIDVPPEELSKLRALGDERVILAANHPSHEPVILFHLSTMLGKEFNFLSAKELFTKSWLQGYVLQRIGCYSVVRGTNDKQSFGMTRRLIAGGERWLTVFPSGQDHYHTDLVLPFQAGVTQLAFWGLEDIRQKPRPPLYMVPVAVRYQYTQDMSGQIDNSLKRLESALNLYEPDKPLGRYSRLLRIAEQLLADNEEAYRLFPLPDDTFDDRLNRVREEMLARVAAGIGTKTPPRNMPLRDRLRQLFNALDAIQPADSNERSEYSRDLSGREEQRALELYRELDRVLAFVAVSGSYIIERPTVERFCDVLTRLEREVTRSECFFGPQRALVKVGEPVNLTEYYERYRQSRRETLQQITLGLENAVRGLLESTIDLLTPIELD